MTAAIEVAGLRKVYRGVAALDGVDLTVPEGSIFGFLGPNGAGKTTTLRILNGLGRPSDGTVRVFGHDAGTQQVRAMTGFLPDVPGFYDWMTAEEFLRFAGGLFGLDRPTLDDRVAVLLDLAGLAGVKTRVGGFSRGMKQRLGVAQALINAPRLLMLDEPTSALDPIGRRDVLEMVLSLKGRTTVFFSTHILADVERVCDTVAILDHGKVVTQASITDLKESYGSHRIVVEVAGDRDAFARTLTAQPWVTGVDAGSDAAMSVVVTDLDQAADAIPRLVVDAGMGLRRLEPGEVGLEEVFVQLVGDETGNAS